MTGSEQPARPSATPNAPGTTRRRPRYVLGTFWVVIALICFIAGFNGLWWGILLGLACVGYAIYLYRGGRYGWFFF